MRDEGLSRFVKTLEKSDENSRLERAARLRFLVKEYGRERWLAFTGGETATRFFEEARDAFLNGQYCATLLLCHGVITQQLVGVFREWGRDELADSDAEDLYRAARDEGVISATDFSIYNNVRKIRNAYVHPPGLGSKHHLARRAIVGRASIREVNARDAHLALRALFLMLNRPRFSAPV